MGNQQAFQKHLDFKDLKTNYVYEKKYSDSRFGELKLLRERSTNQTIFQKDYTSSTQKEFEELIQEIRQATTLVHPKVLKVYGYNTNKEDLFCADFYKLSLFFESFETDLETEIARRQAKKEKFSEDELWYIMDSVSSGAAYLQSKNIPHRDIRPYNVFITRDNEYKIIPTGLFKQNYNPGLIGDFDGLEARSRYYGPEVLQYHKVPADKRTPINEYKNDVFGLGMTMLEAASLERTKEVYDFDKLSAKEAPLRATLDKLRPQYSEGLVGTVESALEFNPEHRLDFTRLDQGLSNYRRDIQERARGKGVFQTPTATAAPVIDTPRETPQEVQQPVRQNPISPERAKATAPPQYNDDLDRKVLEAVRRSEEVIRKSSPSKSSNKNLDPYIQAYLRNDLPARKEPLLSAISPYLTSESKYTTTLTIEQPNYGRESQPINFNAGFPHASQDFGESVKRSGFVEVGSPKPQGDLGRSSAAYDGLAGVQNQAYDSHRGLDAYGGQYYQNGTPYGQSVQQNRQPTFGNANTQSARSYLPAGDLYTATSATLTQQQGAAVLTGPSPGFRDEADDLSKRIEDRLRQSRQLSQHY